MKKLIISMFIIASATMFATEAPKLNKEVQGINKEELEVREIKKARVDLENQKVNTKDIDKNIENQNESIKLVQNDKNLEDEISQDIDSGSSIWKYILGGLAVVGIAFAL